MLIDYNLPITLSEVNILDSFLIEDAASSRKIKGIVFEMYGKYYRYKYESTSRFGAITIEQFDNELTALRPLSTTGNSKVIYNTFNSGQCTELGNFIEFSIMKWDKTNLFKPVI